MKMRSALLIAMLATAGWAKDRAWQDGSLLDPRSNRYFPSMERSGDADRAPSSPLLSSAQAVPSNTIYDHYVVESEEAVYLVERGRFKSSKPAELRLYRPVKFAVDKKKLWLLDEEGKEQQAVILKQVEKQAAHPSVTASLPAR